MPIQNHIMGVSDPDYILDITSVDKKPEPSPSNEEFRGRPWLAIKWTCCGAYSRVYRNAEGDAYQGRCPRCNRSVRAPIGEGGTSQRFFEAK